MGQSLGIFFTPLGSNQRELNNLVMIISTCCFISITPNQRYRHFKNAETQQNRFFPFAPEQKEA